MELLSQISPNAVAIAFLLNPKNPNASLVEADARKAARIVGRQLIVLTASDEGQLDAAFATISQQGIGALVVATADPFFVSRREQLVGLATRYGVPTIYPLRDFVEIGGLMSYGTNQANGHRLAGKYVGQILKGATPADLPVQQSTKIELAINLKTAKVLGLTIPQSILLRADEQIE